MRMSRWDWLKSKLQPLLPRPKVKREKREPKKKRAFLILGKEFWEHTASEARARAKEHFGKENPEYKKRLPAGTVVVDVEKEKNRRVKHRRA